MGKPHILAIPFPAQGHVMPLMELSNRLVDHGIKVTFVNTEFNHARVVAALHKHGHDTGDRVRLASIPDGLLPEEDRNNVARICQAIYDHIPRHLEELIREINQCDEDKITCIIADGTMGSALVVAEKMGIRSAMFWPAATGLRLSLLLIPKMIKDGIIDANGIPTKNQLFRLAPSMPEMNSGHFVWNCMGDQESGQAIYKFIHKSNENIKLANQHLFNSCYEIEPSAFDLIPQALPIGPLLTNAFTDRLVGNFWPEDSTCLSWLDEQPPSSVIYVAFGSFAILNQRQFHELALGLELTGRPFLWVVRPDLMDGASATYPDGFVDRVGHHGKIVSWVPQQKVLAHPSVGVFMSHCGWNSTTEGLSNGIPFLCWPYFADQLMNQSYICDVWRIGCSLERDGNGIIIRDEVKKKMDCLVGDKGVKTRAMELAEMAKRAVDNGGASWQNLNGFIQSLGVKN